jgi:hypothetical protein
MSAINGLVAFLIRLAETETDDNIQRLADSFLDLHIHFRDKAAERKAKPLASLLLLKPDLFEEPEE